MLISMELDNLTSGVVVVDEWTYNASGANIPMNSDRSLPHLHPCQGTSCLPYFRKWIG